MPRGTLIKAVIGNCAYRKAKTRVKIKAVNCHKSLDVGSWEYEFLIRIDVNKKPFL